MANPNSYAVKRKEKSGAVSSFGMGRVQWVTVTGVLMGMNIALCAFGIPVPGGHLYLNDVVICTAALLMDAPAAFMVGGVGAMLGDMLFYPPSMFVSLFAHGLQAVVISLVYHAMTKRTGALDSRTSRVDVTDRRKAAAVAATLIGAVIMVTGYTLGKIYVYSTFEYAMVKLPYEIAQALLGVAGSFALCFRGRLMDYYTRLCRRD